MDVSIREPLFTKFKDNSVTNMETYNTYSSDSGLARKAKRQNARAEMEERAKASINRRLLEVATLSSKTHMLHQRLPLAGRTASSLSTQTTVHRSSTSESESSDSDSAGFNPEVKSTRSGSAKYRRSEPSTASMHLFDNTLMSVKMKRGANTDDSSSSSSSEEPSPPSRGSNVRLLDVHMKKPKNREEKVKTSKQEIHSATDDSDSETLTSSMATINKTPIKSIRTNSSNYSDSDSSECGLDPRYRANTYEKPVAKSKLYQHSLTGTPSTLSLSTRVTNSTSSKWMTLKSETGSVSGEGHKSSEEKKKNKVQKKNIREIIEAEKGPIKKPVVDAPTSESEPEIPNAEDSPSDSDNLTNMKKVAKTKKISNPRLDEFEVGNTSYHRFSFKNKSPFVNLSKNEDVYLLQVPATITPKCLRASLSSLLDNTKLKVGKVKYVVKSTSKECEPIFVMTDHLEKVQPAGSIKLEKYVKNPNMPEMIDAETKLSSLTDNIKKRHPLFGPEYENRIRRAHNIEKKLQYVLTKRHYRTRGMAYNDIEKVYQKEEAIFKLIDQIGKKSKKFKQVNNRYLEDKSPEKKTEAKKLIDNKSVPKPKSPIPNGAISVEPDKSELISKLMEQKLQKLDSKTKNPDRPSSEIPMKEKENSKSVDYIYTNDKIVEKPVKSQRGRKERKPSISKTNYDPSSHGGTPHQKKKKRSQSFQRTYEHEKLMSDITESGKKHKKKKSTDSPVETNQPLISNLIEMVKHGLGRKSKKKRKVSGSDEHNAVKKSK